MRWGWGPVFVLECRTSARRWQVYAGRVVFVVGLLAALTVVWASEVAPAAVAGTALTIRDQAAIGERFFYAIVGVQLSLVLLAAPASTAGAICLDRAQGTLDQLMVTDLSDAEIVLGKLAARLSLVLGLVACTLPVMALGTLLGGIAPDALVGSLLVTLGCSALGCSLALALSVWATRTYEVLLATMGVWACWIVSYPAWWVLSKMGWLWSPPGWLGQSHPFVVALGPVFTPGSISLVNQFEFLVVSLTASAVLVAFSVATIRSAAVRHAGRPGWARPEPTARVSSIRRVVDAWLPGPSLDGNPVLWREWHRKQPSRWARVVWLSYAALAIGVSLLALDEIFLGSSPQVESVAVLNGFQVSIGLLLLSASASTSLADERVRGSLVVLMTTPLTTREILWGKWWGTFRTAPHLAVLPGLVTAALALSRPPQRFPFLTIGCCMAMAAAITSLSLALARRVTRLGHTRAVGVAAHLVVFVGGLATVSGFFDISYFLMECVLIGMVLAHGAALTSLGLALATWVYRPARAIGLCVSAYVLMLTGWVFAVVILFDGKDPSTGLAMGSPFFGVVFGTMSVWNRRPLRVWPAIGWSSFWIVVYGAISAGLLLTTLASFDRALGRISDRPQLLPRRSSPKRVRERGRP